MYVTTIKPKSINHLKESILVNSLGEGTHGTIELYQCKQIVESHHGSISVVSTEEEGTTFSILLPLIQSE